MLQRGLDTIITTEKRLETVLSKESKKRLWVEREMLILFVIVTVFFFKTIRERSLTESTKDAISLIYLVFNGLLVSFKCFLKNTHKSIELRFTDSQLVILNHPKQTLYEITEISSFRIQDIGEKRYELVCNYGKK